MSQERIAFENWLGIKPCGAAHDLAWAAWRARASLPAPQQATPATPEDMKVYDGIAAGYFADAQQATPEPVGEAWGWAVNSMLFRGEFAEDDAKAEAKRCGGTTSAVALYDHPAPGVPEGFALVPVEPTPKVAMVLYEGARNCFSPKVAEVLWQDVLAAAQAKGGEHARS